MDDKTTRGLGAALTAEQQRAESQLLMWNIEHALSTLARATASGDPARITHALQQATDTYGSIRHLLPKIGLDALYVEEVEAQLERLRTRLAS